MDSAFLFPLLTACSLFRLQLQLPFECIDLFKKKKLTREFIMGPALVSKQALFFFCRLNLAIALQSAVLWLFLSQ
jgi:hypothetical protein